MAVGTSVEAVYRFKQCFRRLLRTSEEVPQGSHYGWLQIGNHWVQYRAHLLPSGEWSVGTYVIVRGALLNR